MDGNQPYFHIENDPRYSGLNVNQGIEPLPSVNDASVKRFLKNKKKRSLSVEQFVEGIINGDITILSQAVTLIESSKPDHQEIAQNIIMKCLPFAGNSVRIGITGVPGVGKSTFIEAMGKFITAQGKKLAVLAIDPSSERTTGRVITVNLALPKITIGSFCTAYSF